jgi:hypothetical protein
MRHGRDATLCAGLAFIHEEFGMLADYSPEWEQGQPYQRPRGNIRGLAPGRAASDMASPPAV